MDKRVKNIVLYSGGLDSFITAKILEFNASRESIYTVYIELGHRYQLQEVEAVIRTIPDTHFLTGLGSLGRSHEEADAYIWHRNAFLVLIAAKMIREGERGTIWLTVQEDEMAIPDRSPEFMMQMEEVLHTLGQNIEIRTLWEKKDKTDMVRVFLENGGNVEKLKKTHSCYRPEDLACGDCPAYIRRYIAMMGNGIEEEYSQDPRESCTAKEYVKRAKAGEFSEKRTRRTLEALDE